MSTCYSGPDAIGGRCRETRVTASSHAEWDGEANVWVATSDDVPGLITEASSVEILTEKLAVLIPELFETKGALVGKALGQVPINLIAHRKQLVTLRH